jgi:hypothetical protein
MIVISNKSGQLGNRLHVFAHFLALAIEHDLKLFNPCFGEYAKYFPATSRDWLCRYPRRRALVPPLEFIRHLAFLCVTLPTRALAKVWPHGPFHEAIHMKAGKMDIADEEFVENCRRKIVLTIGWLFRCHDLFEKHADQIREFFRPNPEHVAAIENLIVDARRDRDLLVGVHIRQGDYATYLGGKFFYSREQYIDFMRQVVALFPEKRVGFLVCSNSDHPREAFGDLHVSLGTGHLVEDMYAFAECDYLMGVPSSFTGWASFMGEVPLHCLYRPDETVELEKFRFHSG